MNTLITIGIIGAAIVFCLIGIFVAIKKFYVVPKADEALVVTGGKEPKISTGGGRWVIPMFHKVARVSLQAIRVPIIRIGPDSVPSADMIPSEIKGEMFVQVNPQDTKAIVLAVQSLGTSNPDHMADLVRKKIDSQVTDALRTAAFQKTFIALNSEKKDFADQVMQLLQEDLNKLGLNLISVAVTHVTQGPFTQEEGDVIAAQGRRNVADTVQKNRQETNLITRNAEIEVQKQDVEAREKALELEFNQKKAEADQKRNVDEYEAAQTAETKKNVLLQQQAEEEAQAAQERAIAEAKAREAEKSEKAEIEKSKQVAIANAQAESEKATADAEKRKAEEEAERVAAEAEIAKSKAVEAARIEKEKALKVADEERQQAIEEAEVVRQKAVALVRAEEAAAKATQAAAEAEQKRAEEQVLTAEAEERAKREKVIVTIKAQEDAEKDRIDADKAAYVEVKKAEGERDAAKNRAEAVEAEAKGRADAKKAQAQGDAEAINIAAQAYANDVTARATADEEAAAKQAEAKKALAEATLKEGEAAAEAERLMVEAKNKLSSHLVLRDVALAAIDQAPSVVREIMEPVGKVAHDVKILQVNGLGGEDGEGASGLPATILNTGLAAAGVKPFLTEALKAVKDDPDMKDALGSVSGVIRGVVREAASGVKEGLNGSDNGVEPQA